MAGGFMRDRGRI